MSFEVFLLPPVALALEVELLSQPGRAAQTGLVGCTDGVWADNADRVSRIYNPYSRTATNCRKW